MVRKLKTGEVYKYYIVGFNNVITSNCTKNSDIWVDENNFEHSENGLPSSIDYNKKKKISRVIFRNKGFLHNLNGHSIIFYNEDGSICGGSYWIYGKRYDDKKEWEIEVNRLRMLEEINN